MRLIAIFRIHAFAVIAILCALVMISLPGCATTQQKTEAKATAAPVITATDTTVKQSATAQAAAGKTVASAGALDAALHQPAAASQPGASYAAQADQVKADAAATAAAVGVVAKSAATAKTAAAALPAKIVSVEQQNVAVGKAKVKSGWIYQLGVKTFWFLLSVLLLAGLVVCAEIWGNVGTASTGFIGILIKCLGFIKNISVWLFGWVDTAFLWVKGEIEKLLGVKITPATASPAVTQGVTPAAPVATAAAAAATPAS